MNLEAKTIMGQMQIVSGQWVSDVPNVLAVREPVGQPAMGRRKGDLFIVVQLLGCEMQSPLGHQVSQTLATTIRNTYYHSPSSIAASLRRALIAGNAWLLDAESVPSAASGANRRITAGAVVMAVHSGDVFVATVGPSGAYLLNRGMPIRFPETAHWPDEGTTHPSSISVLGQSMDVEVDISHANAADRDLIVLGDGRFANRAGREAILAALSSGSVEDALAILGRAAGEQDCTAVVVQVRLLPEVDGRENRAPAQPRSSAARPTTGNLRPMVRQQLGTVLGGVMANIARLPVGQVLRSAGKRAGRLFLLLGQGLVTVLRAALPGGPHNDLPTRPEFESSQEPEKAGRRAPQRLLRAVALVLPLLVVLLVLWAYWRQVADQQAAYDASLLQAAAFYEQAVSNQDGPAARAFLEQADGLLAAAAEVNPDDPIIYDLRNSVQIERDRLDRVERLYWIGRLHSYEGDLVRLRRVVVDGADVYVLDAGNDAVYHHQLNETMDGLRLDVTDAVLVQRAQQVGTSVVGEMIDMAWVQAAGTHQTSSLVVLEGDGLLEYSPRMGLNAMPVGGAEHWLGPVAAAGYGGNYYILDSPAGQIFRYLPAGSSYSNLPELYYPDNVPDELRGAIDLAIDGFIYVLHADCTLRKYELGAAVDFSLTGIPTPMTNCVALFTAPDDMIRSLYVVDAGGGRIVQFDKQGRFVRQMKPREEDVADFNDLASIFVDEMSGKLIFLDSHSLYIANLPPAF